MRLATIFFWVAWSGSGRVASMQHCVTIKTSLGGVNLTFCKREIKVVSEVSEPVSSEASVDAQPNRRREKIAVLSNTRCGRLPPG
jgi:hypothetical protein